MAFLSKPFLSRCGVWAWWFSLCLSGQPFRPAGFPLADEYHVKAIFLYNFAKFVDWPAEMSDGPMCIGIIGDDPFGQELDQVVRGKTVNGRGFTVKRLQPDAARTCQILFIAASEKKRYKTILSFLKNAGVLTVGESTGFCESGGVINLEIVESKVRFDVNLDAAARARLRLSSKLLGLARIVRDRSD